MKLDHAYIAAAVLAIGILCFEAGTAQGAYHVRNHTHVELFTQGEAGPGAFGSCEEVLVPDSDSDRMEACAVEDKLDAQ